jgi:hypothetical protein
VEALNFMQLPTDYGVVSILFGGGVTHLVSNPVLLSLPTRAGDQHATFRMTARADVKLPPPSLRAALGAVKLPAMAKQFTQQTHGFIPYRL